MASGIIHYAITNEIIKRQVFSNPGRLLLGVVLPDYGYQGNSHLKLPVAGGHKRTYDFEGFREMFGELMRTDELYLGYYLHLVQDILFRHFLFDRYHWDPTVPENTTKLNRDYEIGNAYVVQKYQLQNTLTLPADFENEAINRICRFDLTKLQESMDAYFDSQDDGDIFFFTKDMTDEFIAEAADYCLKEITNLQVYWKDAASLFSGGNISDLQQNTSDLCSASKKPDVYGMYSGCADSYVLAWDNKPKSLLETTLNTRDLGGYRIAGTKEYTKYNRIYRSDLAKEPSEGDIDFLKKNGITTIIDLRLEAEAQKAANGFASARGFTYFNFPNVEGSYLPTSVDEIPHSYQVIAESRSMTQVMRTIAYAPAGVMFNCSAGKDRTGTTSAVLLWLCGVSTEDIIYDYMITKQTNAERFKRVKVNFPDLDINVVIPNENNMREFLNIMTDRYGTAERYFSSLGITEDEQQRIIEKLTKNL